VFSIVREFTVATPTATLVSEINCNREPLAALTTVREWPNSFVLSNCAPTDILYLIPTHLSSQKDRFRAFFVCRHWRRTIFQCTGLWSHLCFSKGEVYQALLVRAKGPRWLRSSVALILPVP